MTDGQNSLGIEVRVVGGGGRRAVHPAVQRVGFCDRSLGGGDDWNGLVLPPAELLVERKDRMHLGCVQVPAEGGDHARQRLGVALGEDRTGVTLALHPDEGVDADGASVRSAEGQG